MIGLLRRIFVEDLALKLAALFGAFAIWLWADSELRGRAAPGVDRMGRIEQKSSQHEIVGDAPKAEIVPERTGSGLVEE